MTWGGLELWQGMPGTPPRSRGPKKAESPACCEAFTESGDYFIGGWRCAGVAFTGLGGPGGAGGLMSTLLAV